MSKGAKEKNSHLNHLLGTDTDEAVAAKMGLSFSTVIKRRKLAGIPAFKTGYGWTPKTIALLGTMTDAAIAIATGKTKASVHQKRTKLGIPAFREQKVWSEDEIKLLGTDADKAIAVQVGRTEASVRMARVERGIKPKIRPESWHAIKQLPQGELFAALQKLHDTSKPKLTHKHLSELTGYSLSRINKWMTPGTAQEPLSLSIRHHLFLSVLHRHYI